MNQQVRQERVAGGSRRKRDLEAVQPSQFDARAYWLKHFPDEQRHAVVAVAWKLHKQTGVVPSPDAVLAGMKAKGWTRVQRGLS